jgi:hypothetical protein
LRHFFALAGEKLVQRLVGVEFSIRLDKVSSKKREGFQSRQFRRLAMSIERAEITERNALHFPPWPVCV